MLYLFLGEDVTRAKAEAQKRAEGHEVVRFGEGGEPFSAVGGYLGQQGMFAPKVALILDRPLDDTEGKELLLEKGTDIVGAEALVIAIQPDIDAATKKKLPKGIKIEKFDAPEAAAELPPPNVFALADAVSAGDRKKAWILYRQLIMSGASPEEVHGALAWAVRGIVLATKTKSADEAGMKSFPYAKAKQATLRIKPAEAEAMSAELVAIYHQARSGRGSLEDLLEVFLLKK